MDFKPDATFIDAGRGEGVIDRLRQLGFQNIFEVHFGGIPLSPGAYHDKRSEMWGLMKEWLMAGGAIPDMAEIVADLVVPTYSYDAANAVKLEANDKIKERLGKSPDIGSALALTFAMPVQVKVNAYGQNIGKTLEFARTTEDVFA